MFFGESFGVCRSKRGHNAAGKNIVLVLIDTVDVTIRKLLTLCWLKSRRYRFDAILRMVRPISQTLFVHIITRNDVGNIIPWSMAKIS